MFTNKKREGIDTFVCAVSLYVAETPTCKASIKDHESPLPIIPFGIVAYGFVGQPFSKQLYISVALSPQARTSVIEVRLSRVCSISYSRKLTTYLMLSTKRSYSRGNCRRSPRCSGFLFLFLNIPRI